MIGYAPGDGLTEMESLHWQIVDIGPVHNGLGPDLRDWRTLLAYRARIERAKRDCGLVFDNSLIERAKHEMGGKE